MGEEEAVKKGVIVILPKQQQVTNTELMAEEYAYDMLERQSPKTLSGIEKDIKELGLDAKMVASIWRRTMGQDPMARMVFMAAKFIERENAEQ